MTLDPNKRQQLKNISDVNRTLDWWWTRKLCMRVQSGGSAGLKILYQSGRGEKFSLKCWYFISKRERKEKKKKQHWGKSFVGLSQHHLVAVWHNRVGPFSLLTRRQQVSHSQQSSSCRFCVCRKASPLITTRLLLETSRAKMKNDHQNVAQHLRLSSRPTAAGD